MKNLKAENRSSQSIGLYRELILLYPPSYINRHRQELLQNFSDLEKDLGSGKSLWIFIINDLIKSLPQQYMEFIKHSRVAQIGIGILLILGIFCGYQLYYLNKAHSSFENYAAFRGCITVFNQTATSANCTLKSNTSIKLVKINDKWYLDGDGPGIW